MAEKVDGVRLKNIKTKYISEALDLITKDSLICYSIYWHQAVTDCFILKSVLACVCCKIVVAFKPE